MGEEAGEDGEDLIQVVRTETDTIKNHGVRSIRGPDEAVNHELNTNL